jgi:hypothetical protein
LVLSLPSGARADQRALTLGFAARVGPDAWSFRYPPGLAQTSVTSTAFALWQLGALSFTRFALAQAWTFSPG